MKQYTTPILCALSLYIAASCSQDRDLALTARLAEMNLTSNNFMLDREERNQKLDSMGKRLSVDYPAGPPFGHDSTRRIFRFPLPATVSGMKLSKIDTAYTVAPEAPDVMKSVLEKKYRSQKYFFGTVEYIQKNRKIGTGRACSIIIEDLGRYPEWFVQRNSDRLEKGENGELFSDLRQMFEMDRTITYKGHTWQVWTPNALFTKLAAYSPAKGNLAGFTTFWNRRFVVTMIDMDTAATQLETFYKVVDAEWLDKLKSPHHPAP